MLPVFRITDNQRLVVADDDVSIQRVRAGRCIPMAFRLARDLPLAPYGIIPVGALSVGIVNPPDGILSLTFALRWPALRQWDNVLRLYPDCVDTEILDSLRAVIQVPEVVLVHNLSRLAAYLAGGVAAGGG